MKSAVGFVTVVQEQRFQLAADDGSTRLFILAHKAPIEGRDLQALRDRRARIEVWYEDVSDLVAHVAHKVYSLPPRAGKGSKRSTVCSSTSRITCTTRLPPPRAAWCARAIP